MDFYDRILDEHDRWDELEQDETPETDDWEPEPEQ